MHEQDLFLLETTKTALPENLLHDNLADSKMPMEAQQSVMERLRRKPEENNPVRRVPAKGILAAGAVVLLLSAGGGAWATALASASTSTSSLSIQPTSVASSMESSPASSPGPQAEAPSAPSRRSDDAATGALLPVSVTTNVNDAELYIDGLKRDETESGAREWKINLAEGTHDIRVAKDKYQAASMSIDVKQNFETEVQLTLLPTKMQLRPLPRNDSDLIKDLLERRWKRAFESGNLQEVRAIWPGVPAATENAIMSARGITLELTCSPLTNNDMAIARCTQVARFNGKNANGVVVFKVRKTGQAWEINGSM